VVVSHWEGELNHDVMHQELGKSVKALVVDDVVAVRLPA
jgi:hypothetical protein